MRTPASTRSAYAAFGEFKTADEAQDRSQTARQITSTAQEGAEGFSKADSLEDPWNRFPTDPQQTLKAALKSSQEAIETQNPFIEPLRSFRRPIL